MSLINVIPILINIIYMMVFPITSFPPVDGEYGIGRTTYCFYDKDRVETINASSTGRYLMTEIWYPSDQQGSSDYFPKDININEMFGVPYPDFIFNNIKALKTRSGIDLPVSKKKDKYPLLVFSHGFGCSRLWYQFICEELASEGYIVVSIDHPYSSQFIRLPDGEKILSSYTGYDKDKIFNLLESYEFYQISKDQRFVLDELEKINTSSDKSLSGKIDMDNIGLFGHSYGGATSIFTSAIDRRIKAVCNIDGSLVKPTKGKESEIPLLIISGDGFYIFKEDNNAIEDFYKEKYGEKKYLQVIKNFKKNYDEFYEVVGKNGMFISVKGAEHMGFSDFPFLVPKAYFSQKIDNIGLIKETSVLLKYFFNKHLKKESGTEYKEIIKRYPEIVIIK